MPPPTFDVFVKAVLFELRETYHVADAAARLLVLRYPAVLAVEYDELDPTQAARALVLCDLEAGDIIAFPTVPPSGPPASAPAA